MQAPRVPLGLAVSHLCVPTLKTRTMVPHSKTVPFSELVPLSELVSRLQAIRASRRSHSQSWCRCQRWAPDCRQFCRPPEEGKQGFRPRALPQRASWHVCVHVLVGVCGNLQSRAVCSPPQGAGSSKSPTGQLMPTSINQLLYSLFVGPKRSIRLLQATLGCKPNC